MISEVFLTSALTLGIGFLTAALGVCYKSKCTNMDCCCFHIKRDTKTELKEDMAAIRRAESVLSQAPQVQTVRRNSR